MHPSASRSLLGRLRRLLDLPAGEQRLLIEAWWTLLVASVRLRLAARRTLTRALAAGSPAGAPEEAGTSQQQRVAVAVSRAAAHHLWAMTCLPRAIALQRMLARRGIAARLAIGVRKAEPGGSGWISAHAWVEVEGRAVGEPEAIAERFLPFVELR